MSLKKFFVNYKNGEEFKFLVVFAGSKTDVVNYLKSNEKEVVSISMDDSTVSDFGGDTVFSITSKDNPDRSVTALDNDILKLFTEYPNAKEVSVEYSGSDAEVVILR